MSRIYPICSSSKGNSTFIGTRGHGIIVDAGCSFRAMKNALSIVGTNLNESEVEAVFITHEHTDHIKGVEQLVKQTKIPVFASAGTLKAMFHNDIPARFYNAEEGYRSANFEVSSFRTSHDSAMSVGYKIRFGPTRELSPPRWKRRCLAVKPYSLRAITTRKCCGKT